MGFTPEETHYKLVFEDPALAGLTVVAAEVSVDEFAEVVNLAALADPANASRMGAEVRRLLDIFAGSLVEWNVTDKRGNPVPADRRGVGKQGWPLMQKIIDAWMSAQADVPRPLPGSSNGGGRSLEASIPMAPLSPSRSS